VPAELVWDHSLAKFLRELDDPYLAGARLHDGPGAIWAADALHGKPAWVFTHHALIAEAYADFEHFSNRRGGLNSLPPERMFLPLEVDPPEHIYYRQILAPFFTPGRMAARSADIRQLSNALIDTFHARGTCEFIAEFGSILPNAMVLSLMGMPQARLRDFLAWE
jgi:cytochrome P450